MTIGNETQDDLDIHIKCCDSNLDKSVFVGSGKELQVYISGEEWDNKGTKASNYIKSISVFKLDNTRLIYLKGSAIDKRVIHTGERKYNVYFRFGIKEEDFGFGINKEMNFEEEIEENQDF
jgi:hypothetical protein